MPFSNKHTLNILYLFNNCQQTVSLTIKFINFAAPYQVPKMKFPFAFSKLSRKKKISISIVLASLILIFATCHFLFPTILQHIIAHKIQNIEKEKQITISHSPIAFADFSIFGNMAINIAELTVQDNNASEALFSSQNLHCKVQVWKGLHRCLALQSLSSDKICLNIVKQGKYNNYTFLKKQNGKNIGDRNYAQQINNILSLLQNVCPDELQINQLELNFDIDSLKTNYLFSPLKIVQHELKSKLIVSAINNTTNWELSGYIDNARHLYRGELTLAQNDLSNAAFALPKSIENVQPQFHQIKGELNFYQKNNTETKICLAAQLEQFSCEHRYLADQPILIDSIGAQLNINIFKEKIEIEPSSTLILNEIIIHPYLCYEPLNGQHVIFRIDEKDSDAGKLFHSLPHELFQVIPKLQVEGGLDYSLSLDYNSNLIDSLKLDFNIGCRKQNFRIIKGLENITRFNEPFEYVFYENGDTARVVPISPENPYFCSYTNIPPFLTQAILASEDGAFFQHNGFIKSSIQSALIADIKAKKLVRGGSTISMQLIKNLFLNRGKRFSRKFEEFLLVWMIEHYHLMTKERMFEIYVNIAEWGPHIIGIGEASEFYFNKKPSELTFPECVYLASLIRAPKHFAYTLNNDGTITVAKQQEISAVAQRMVERGFMTETQWQEFDPQIKTIQTRPSE